jgi:hypothetical protein
MRLLIDMTNVNTVLIYNLIHYYTQSTTTTKIRQLTCLTMGDSTNTQNPLSCKRLINEYKRRCICKRICLSTRVNNFTYVSSLPRMRSASAGPVFVELPSQH